MFRSISSLGSKHILPAFLACCFLSLAAPTGSLFAQDPPPQNLPPPANPPATSPDSPTKSPQETPAREGQEVSTQDTPAPLKCASTTCWCALSYGTRTAKSSPT